MKRALFAVLVASLLGALAWALWPRSTPQAPPKNAEAPAKRAADAHASPHLPPSSHQVIAARQTPAPRPPTSEPVAPKAPKVTAPKVTALKVTARATPDPQPKPVPAPEPEWTDPTHKRVLGPARWMAQPDEATRAALDHAIDASPAPAEVARQAALHTLHTNGRERARAEAQACVTRLAPDIQGRVMIGTDLRARSGRGVFVSPRILAAVYLDDPDLHACILDALARARFDAGEDIDLPDARFPLFF